MHLDNVGARAEYRGLSMHLVYLLLDIFAYTLQTSGNADPG